MQLVQRERGPPCNGRRRRGLWESAAARAAGDDARLARRRGGALAAGGGEGFEQRTPSSRACSSRARRHRGRGRRGVGHLAACATRAAGRRRAAAVGGRHGALPPCAIASRALWSDRRAQHGGARRWPRLASAPPKRACARPRRLRRLPPGSESRGVSARAEESVCDGAISALARARAHLDSVERLSCSAVQPSRSPARRVGRVQRASSSSFVDRR